MMTCGSERSGIASRGILRSDQTPYSVRQIVSTTISIRLCAENSMMRLIISFASTRRDVGFGNANHVPVLPHGHCGLPRPRHPNLDLAGIDAVPAFTQRRLGAHRRHG